MRRIVCLLVLCISALSLAACSGRHNTPDASPAPGENQPAAAQVRSTDLAQAISEIQAAPTPAGLKSDIYTQLKAQLILQLKARGISKVASGPPSGSGNEVKDLELLGDDSSSYSLQWTYLSTGDYNGDGLVTVNDLTPIGVYFQKGVDDDTWPMARKADGNADGHVTVNDITPIGLNYQTRCTGYNVYGSLAEAGPWTLLGDTALPAVQDDPSRVLTYGPLDNSYYFFQVRPHDDMGNEGTPSQVSRRTITPPVVSLGSDTFDVTTHIDPATGGDSVMDLGGGRMLNFNFPPGCTDAPFDFRIGTNDGSFTPPIGSLIDPLIAVDTGGNRSFHKPITITVEFNRQFPIETYVPFIVDDAGALKLIDLTSITAANGQATFQTWQLTGHLLWVYGPLDFSDFLPFVRSTKFTPAYDGMQIVNTGSVWFPGGECFGMTAFADWYYGAGKTWSEGNLFPRFMYVVPVSGGIQGQHVIATRAFASITKEWDTYWNTFVGPQGNLTDAQRFASVVLGLIFSGGPVLIDLRHENGSGGAHSVLAYGCDSNGLLIYDPNDPGHEDHIIYNSGSGTFTPYGGYDSIRYSGSGALYLDESYQSILDDAKQKFASNGYATVTIDGFTSGFPWPWVTPFTVQGHIVSTVEKVDEIDIVTELGDEYDISVPSGGNFSQTLSLHSGDNTLYFSCWSHRVGGARVFIPCDLPNAHFNISGI